MQRMPPRCAGPRRTSPRSGRRWPSGRDFTPESVVIQAAPTWKGIVEVAKQREVSLIVLGPHRRSGLVGHLLGSVTAAVVAHTASSVLIVRSWLKDIYEWVTTVSVAVCRTRKPSPS